MSGQIRECFPYLIFLVNFKEEQFRAIEFHVNKQANDLFNSLKKSNKLPEGTELNKLLPLKKLGSSDNNKRNELYLKGGIFSVTYQQLVLDLLSMKLSPHIISGMIVCNVHKVKQNCSEAFLAQLIKK